MQANVQSRTRKLVILAMLSAIAYVVMYFGRISLIPAAAFLKYDPKDVIIAIGGFLYGPVAALAMSVVVAFAEMVTVSESGIIGCIMNIISSVAFTCSAAFIYKKLHTLVGAAIGLVVGVALCTTVMLLWNYLLVPIYTPYISREAVMSMLAPIFLPFNLLKGGLNAAVAMLLYKPVRLALSKSGLTPVSVESGVKTTKLNIAALLVSAFVIATCVLIILAMQGVI